MWQGGNACVLYRVMELAERKAGFEPNGAPGFQSMVSLTGILGEIMKTGAASKKVVNEYWRLVKNMGPELSILLDMPIDLVRQKGSETLAHAIERMRSGKVSALPGYDGEFGVIKVFGE